MILNIVKASASWTDKKFSVAFEVEPEGRYHLDLATGEIFQNSRYARLRDNEGKIIKGTLFIMPQEADADGAPAPNTMAYFPHGREEGSGELWFSCRLAPDKLTEFHSLIRSGNIPRQAIIQLESDSIRDILDGRATNKISFGWEPDGSGQKWDNNTHQCIGIEEITFNFGFPVPPADDLPFRDEPNDEFDRSFFADAAQARYALFQRFSRLEQVINRRLTGWTNFGVLAALGFIIWRMVR